MFLSFFIFDTKLVFPDQTLRSLTTDMGVYCLQRLNQRTHNDTTQLSMKFSLLINVKIPTINGILTFMSRKNSILGLYESEKKTKFFLYFYNYEHLKFHAKQS